MPIECLRKRSYGREVCPSACATALDGAPWRYVRVERGAPPPPRDRRTIDVAILDMNHGWPNLGHDSVVHAVQDAVCDLVPHLLRHDLAVRAISFEVRRDLRLPEPPNGRYALYVGTGGPGHLDPRHNDGVSPGSQGIRENPAWEKPLYALFEAIARDESAALVAVCHTFGLVCRWLGAARPVLRGPEKGGKSAGIVESVLTDEALRHPWFARLASRLPDRRRLKILDSRLYDLIPDGGRLPDGAVAIGFEALGIGGPPGDALTMMEVARDREGVMPRFFGSNHHPEVVNAARLMSVLQRKFDEGEVSRDWYEERRKTLEASFPDERADRRLHLTSDFTILAPVRFFLWRQLRMRLESLGVAPEFHERQVLEAVDRSAS